MVLVALWCAVLCGAFWFLSACDIDSVRCNTQSAPFFRTFRTYACCSDKTLFIRIKYIHENGKIYLVGRNWNGIKAEKTLLYQRKLCKRSATNLMFVLNLQWQRLHLSFESFQIPDLHINVENYCAIPSNTHTRPSSYTVSKSISIKSTKDEMIIDICMDESREVSEEEFIRIRGKNKTETEREKKKNGYKLWYRNQLIRTHNWAPYMGWASKVLWNKIFNIQ